MRGETALILPTLGRSDRDIQASGEQFVTVEDSISQVGKAEFTCNEFTMLQPPEGHLVLQSLRSHDKWNTIPNPIPLDSIGDICNTPTSKGVVVRLEPAS